MAGKMRWSKVAHVMAAREQKRWKGLDCYLPPEGPAISDLLPPGRSSLEFPEPPLMAGFQSLQPVSLLEGQTLYTPTTAGDGSVRNVLSFPQQVV